MNKVIAEANKKNIFTCIYVYIQFRLLLQDYTPEQS